MQKRTVPGAIAIFLLLVTAVAAVPTGKWVEVRSANFIVVGNAGEAQARKIAAQFEQIRSVFRDSLPYTKTNSSPVITILAVKDEESLRELLPEYWAEKGHAHPAGIFIGAYNQFQVAINLSAHGDNPYEGLYHEYYHSVTVPYFPGLPTWVAEGMADFFGNSIISDKTADLGMPNAGLIEELRSKPLIPLPVLFKVDHNSPYYNEQNKVSIFYAESWALIHYLMLGDHRAHTAAFGVYLSGLGQGASQDEAAAKAFGDIPKLQENLQAYIGRFIFPALQVPTPARVPDSDLSPRALSQAEVDAYCGGFLALHNQFQQAEPLLKEAAQLDPKLALAQRNLALLHFSRQERPDALASLSAAIALDSQDATTRYLRAQLTFDDVSHTDPQIEEDLRQALALKPDSAPANGLLAVYLAANNEKLPEALAFGQKAVSLEPGNTNFQLAVAQVLARMRRYDDAETLGRRVRAATTDDRVRAQADQILAYIGQIRDYDVRAPQMQADAAARASASASAARSDTASTEKVQDSGSDSGAPILKRRVPATDVHGVVTQVHCNGNEMEVTVKVDARPAPLVFRAKDRTRIGYTSTIPTVHDDVEPCSELKGHAAKLAFTPPEAKPFEGELVHIEVEK
jgi:thioredoxin-like negative regulator of GroEL